MIEYNYTNDKPNKTVNSFYIHKVLININNNFNNNIITKKEFPNDNVDDVYFILY